MSSLGCYRYTSQGFGLVEMIISMTILGLMITSLLPMISHTVMKSADPQVRVQAIMIAESYLEEIMLKPIDDPDGLTETSRFNFDNIEDYHGLTNAPPQNQFENQLSNLNGYQVNVTIEPDNSWGAVALPAGEMYRIDVEVQMPNSETVLLSAYRARYL